MTSYKNPLLNIGSNQPTDPFYEKQVVVRQASDFDQPLKDGFNYFLGGFFHAAVLLGYFFVYLFNFGFKLIESLAFHSFFHRLTN